ncbi:exo-alpha-sialidase [Paenibacillus mesophilus]|uniref:sialidase family protein n=1 Tax=Paenibacillus mesophilus TaxID=2582849 RepID=UPI00110EBB9C|nr:sialidase family protein [Paenibacillus mesophilus]TMV45645.1 exo-alpha-sialidase [Paenibacillus mesophilus]
MDKIGKVVLELGPSAGNPRNSEGAFIDLPDGRLLFVYSRFIGDSNADDAPSCIASRYSGDGGETWSEDTIIAKAEEHGARNIMSVSLLRMENGDIGLFYFVRRARNDGRLHLRRSSDEGKTWSEARCCIPGLGYYVTNNDRVVRLSGGRLIIPTSFHKMAGEEADYSVPHHQNDSRGIAHFFLSDDDGRAWREAKTFCAMHAPHAKSGLQEPGVIELTTGVLWSWARTDAGCQYEMFSMDKGETWSQAAPSQFSSPRSPLSMKRIPASGSLLAVWNPVPNYQTRMLTGNNGGRTPLIAGISRDDGQTWKRFFYLEKEEDRGGYCYTAIHFVHDAVLLAYCAGLPEDGSRLARLRIRKVGLSELGAL